MDAGFYSWTADPKLCIDCQLLKIPSMRSSKKLAVLMKFVFMRVELFFIMQISFFAKVVLFLTLYCISDLSIKNNILRKVMNRANRAKKI